MFPVSLILTVLEDYNPEGLQGVDDGLTASNGNTLQWFCAVQRSGSREAITPFHELQMFYYLKVKYIVKTETKYSSQICT